MVAVKRGLSKVEDNFFPRPASGFSNVYNRKTVDAVKVFQKLNGIKPTGQLGQMTLDALESYMDARAKALYERFEVAEKSEAPSLGPVVFGGQSVLDHDLTHATGGLDGFPAFDDGFQAGASVLAPEPLKVTGIGSARRRDGNPNGKSVHATGVSGIRYWFGHVENPRVTGSAIPKGERFAIVSGNHEMPHLHVGIDASALIGHELEHHTDYTHGGRTVGEQLR